MKVMKDLTTPSPRRNAQAGFTLVEALCAVVILSFGLMAVANLMIVAASSNSVANQSSAATALATAQLEQLKSVPFHLLPDPGAGGTLGNLDADDAGFSNFQTVPGVGDVRIRWTVTGIDGQARFIVVRAEGTGALSGARSRAEFTTFRTCTDMEPAPAGPECPAP